MKAVLEAVRQANADGKASSLRGRWPLAHRPLIDLLKKNGQSIPTVCILPNASIIARIGAQYEKGRVVQIIGEKVKDVPNSMAEYCGTPQPKGRGRSFAAVVMSGLDSTTMPSFWPGIFGKFKPSPFSFGGFSSPAFWLVSFASDFPQPPVVKTSMAASNKARKHPFSPFYF